MVSEDRRREAQEEPTPEQIEAERMYAEMGLSEAEYEQIKQLIHRRPNYTETGLFSVMWSEHCSYKHSKPVLSLFPTEGECVLLGPGEGAGVIDIGDGQALVFKMESHNSPSAIEPYHGAATGVGGIMRDIFSMGARPIALLNSLRFGELNDERVKKLFKEAVAGIADYGNGTGVPTVGGDVYFDPSYTETPLVNAMCVGLIKHEDLQKGTAQGIDNLVVYLGAPTGRDGIHGATMSSEELDDTLEKPRHAIPAGNPELEKKVMEACLQLVKEGLLVGMQDMGAAGLTSSSAEMAAKGGCGIELQLDQVPQSEAGMNAYEMMLSETQERMLIVIKPEHLSKVKAICDRWEVPCAAIGRVIEEKRLRIIHDGETKADVPVSSLVDEAPVYHVTAREPARYREALQREAELSKELELLQNNPSETLHHLLSSPTIADKEWVYRQFNHGEQTVVGPGSDAAVVRIEDTHKAVAFSADCNGRYVYLDPRQGGMIAVAEAARNIVCSGGKPLALTNCLNFGSPEDPEIFWQLEEAVRGMSEACNHLGTPVISGNVSLYNETDRGAVYPTPVVGMVGLIDDVAQILTQSFKQAGDQIILLGETQPEFGGSELQKLLTSKIEGRPPQIDLAKEKALQQVILTANKLGLLSSAHDISEGGLAVAVAESALSGDKGVELDLETSLSIAAALFAESQSRVVVSVPEEHVDQVLRLARQEGVPAARIGHVSDNSRLMIRINGQEAINEALSELRRSWKESIPWHMTN